jgi:hypothetical protein
MNNNDYAFPVIISNNTDIGASETGMTLRDYFAARAMQSFIVNDKEDKHSCNKISKVSYLMADAMLKARGE